MSFLETIRGFGRSGKKNKKDESPAYHPPLGYVRNPLSPTRLSPSRRKARQLSPTRDARRSQPPPPPGLPSRRRVQQATLTAKPPLFMCEPFNKTALVKGSFKTIVQLPKYVDYGEWLAVNVFEHFENLNLFYGVLSEYVTPEKFPAMTAGPTAEYLWPDNTGQAMSLPACQYIELVLGWISNKLNDQAVFPTSSGGVFPPTFVKDCKTISRYMFRVFAHIYHHQFEIILHLLLEAHWNSFFQNFISFVKAFQLIDRMELAPLLPLIEDFEAQGKIIM